MINSDGPTGDAAPTLREHPESELTQYRPISILAMGALTCGVLSITAFAYPLLWIVPLVGVTIGAISLWRVDHAEQPLLGRSMALAGLILSVTFGVAAPAQRVTHDYWIGARARRLAEQFFGLVQTDPTHAYRLMFRSQHKGPPERPVNGQAPEKPRSDLEVFLSENPIADLIKLGRNLRYEHVATEVTPFEGGRQAVIVAYDVTDAEHSTARPLKVAFYQQRNFDSQGIEHWFVLTVSRLQTSPLEP